MERAYLQWNLPNWITVTLMGMIGFTVVNAIVAAYRGSPDNG